MRKKLIAIISVSTLIRFFLSGLMFWASLSKLFLNNGINPISQIMISIRAYKVVPEMFVRPFAYILPAFEILVAVMLLFGLWTRIFSILLGLLLLVFAIGIIQAAIRGLQIDCGCFSKGGALEPGQKTKYTFEIIRDIACVGLCSYLAIFPKTFLSLDTILKT
jgi:uncharacterized membrane protein YphA (DoxX/SURF4 family)